MTDSFVDILAAAPWHGPEVPLSSKRATITRRAHQTRVATLREELELPLQQTAVSPLNVERLRERMLPQVKNRLDHIWETLGHALPIEVQHRPSRCLHAADADLLMSTGVVSRATPSVPTRGWVTPFTVVEEKETGFRRRMIAWPKAKNAQDVYEAQLPLQHVSYYLDAVRDEVATVVDLKASFFSG